MVSVKCKTAVGLDSYVVCTRFSIAKQVIQRHIIIATPTHTPVTITSSSSSGTSPVSISGKHEDEQKL